MLFEARGGGGDEDPEDVGSMIKSECGCGPAEAH